MLRMDSDCTQRLRGSRAAMPPLPCMLKGCIALLRRPVKHIGDAPARERTVNRVTSCRNAPTAVELDHAHTRSIRDYPEMARRTSRPYPALLAADAEWREGLHHARGDRLPYEPHLVSFDANDQLTPEYLSLNPNNKIPAIIDPRDPTGSRSDCSSRARYSCTCRQSRRVSSQERRRTVPDDSVAHVPDERGRTDVRAGRVLP